MTRKRELLNILKSEGKTIRINEPDFIATNWQYDPKAKRSWCVCYELLEGRWEGFVSLAGVFNAN